MFGKPFAFLLLRSMLLFMLAAASTGGYGQANSEQQLKAAFLVNFLKYVEWPASANSSAICLFGRDTLGSNLAVFEGRTIAGRELHIRRISGPDQIADCRALFIPDTDEARYGAVLHWVEGLPILTVSDTEVFTRQGGGIALIREDGRLQFDINSDALNRAGLKPSFQMLRLARKVIGGIK